MSLMVVASYLPDTHSKTVHALHYKKCVYYLNSELSHVFISLNMQGEYER